MAGALHLIFIVTFVFSQNVQFKPMVPDDSFVAVVVTAKNLTASQWLFRIGFVSEVLSAVFFLLVAWALYVLLKPVNKDLSLLFVLLNLGGVAIECVSTISHFAAQQLLSNADYLKVFQADQRQALAMFFLNLHGIGQLIAALFCGVWLFPLGYLIFGSGFLSRIFGILLIMDGFCVPTFFPGFSFPGLRKVT